MPEVAEKAEEVAAESEAEARAESEAEEKVDSGAEATATPDGPEAAPEPPATVERAEAEQSRGLVRRWLRNRRNR